MRALAGVALVAVALGGCATVRETLWPAAAPAPKPAEAVPAPAVPARPPVAVPAPPVDPAPAPAPSVAVPPPAVPPPPPAVAPPAPAPPAPAPPPAAAPRPDPPPPPAVLAPAVRPEEERRLERETRNRIDRTEHLVRGLDGRRLDTEQLQRLETVQSFVAKAREALGARDVQRAFTLADKAFLLADELARRGH